MSNSFWNLFKEIFRVVVYCLVIKVLFSVSQTARLLYHIFFYLSRTFLFYFFKFLLSLRQLIQIITSVQLCQQLFLFFTNCFLSELLYSIIIIATLSRLFSSYFDIISHNDSKRRKRDLNPRDAINDLLPFQGSPFSHLGISPNAKHFLYSVTAEITISYFFFNV